MEDHRQKKRRKTSLTYIVVITLIVLSSIVLYLVIEREVRLTFFRGHSSHSEITRSRMNGIYSLLRLYKVDFGTWPPSETWKREVEPYARTCDVYDDAWGNPIQYVHIMEEGNQIVKIYSFGENGIDENGLNDDYVLDVLEREKEGAILRAKDWSSSQTN